MPSRACVPDTCSNVTVMSLPIFTDSPIRRDKTNISLSFFPWLPAFADFSGPRRCAGQVPPIWGQAILYRNNY
jgi:hypothetical protein